MTDRPATTRRAPWWASITATLVVVLAAAGTAACQSDSDATEGASTEQPPPASIVPIAEDPQPALPATVTSADGREVTVESVDRIVSVWGSLTEIALALGFADEIVGRDVASHFEGVEDVPLVTRAHDVSAEGVLSLDPTLVLAQTDTGPPEAIDQIRRAGVPVVLVEEPTGLHDMPGRIRTVAAALGVPEGGEALVERTEAELDAAIADVPDDEPLDVAFLYMRGSAGVYLIGGDGSGADSMIEAVGARDAGSVLGLSTFTPITSESLVAAAPDAILMLTSSLASVGGIDGLLEIPGISQTPAGQNRRIITVDDQLLYSYGPRSGEAVAALAAALYGSTNEGS